ncbi:hypothetical protein CPAR01_08238 [Colletotrichum paranaense]|uniref:Ricin B lectin domain-containing protein n=1 Tax=Colletotrichum paranaense TaxID=1914294 RepID=A0ABQ9SKH1_9PEZI|nr:uncharacterized protein CPAR01_08238 [Colletotrichum paranaense]KAK1538125.1 hypothetical protein CPAR01_08238 [Colletotrichum paranaense]
MAELDSNAWYRLSETRVDNSTGPFALNLQLRDVGLRVHPVTDGTAAWQFQPFGDVKGRYLMRLDQAGVKQQLGVCYDAKEPATGNTVACLQESSVDESQIWEVSAWDGKTGEYKFVNVANGTAYVLDVHPKSNLFMNSNIEGSASATDTQPAQHWVMTSVSAVNDGAYSTIYSGNVAVSTNSATLSLTTTTTTTTKSTTTSGPTATAASQTASTATSTAVTIPTTTGISPGAGAGIGVGVAIGVVGLIGAIAFFWWRRKQPKTAQYSEVEPKHGGSLERGSSSIAGSPAVGGYAAPYGAHPGTGSYPSYNQGSYNQGSPATMSYPVALDRGSPNTMTYPIPMHTSSPSSEPNLSSWHYPQTVSTSALAVPAAVPRHQFDHPAIHNEFAPAASNPSFESTSRFGFASTAASSQANSTTNLNDPDPVPSAHELEVAVRDVPRRQHELGEFHHGPNFDLSQPTATTTATITAPSAELSAFQHGPDTFTQSHEAKMLGVPTAELGSHQHGPDTFGDGHEDKMLGGFPPGAEKYQPEREDKVLGNLHDLMRPVAGQSGRGRRPDATEATEWQSYEMQSFTPR